MSTASAWVLNNPYPPNEANQKIIYSSFPEAPKTLDPAIAYNVNESMFIEQVAEPLLEYHYFKRPYQLVPLIASAMPIARYYAADGRRLTDPDNEPVALSVYTISIQKGITYQKHPAFVKQIDGNYAYLNLPNDYLSSHYIHTLADFPQQATRELVVDDFIYQIKRLASPSVNSPIYGLMQDYIEGLKELNEQLMHEVAKPWVDLRAYPLSGVRKIDAYTFEIRIKGRYQPFLYWLAMHFFAPTPWEVDKFYSQVGMQARNIGFDWNPVGTGPFILTENNPNRRMVLARNPDYRQVFFPEDGDDKDKQMGYLHHVGHSLPLIDKVIYTLEKEAIPRWNKFLQGYYDLSAISADSYDQAIRLNRFGNSELSEVMKKKKFRLTESFEPAIYYTGFNMLDPVVGGRSERARLLRLAISLAINTEESLALFYNGRGKAAHSPLPPSIFGYKDKSNAWLYTHTHRGDKRKPLAVAKTWLRLAGYPNGIDPKTKKPLIIRYDVAASGGPDERAQLEWMRKQFNQIGLSLNIVSTQYNRFQEKMRTGNTQLYSWGWKADYPDPENFFFLLYGPNGKVKYSGENASNYANPHFDELFNEMKNRKNDTMRAQLIDKIIALLQHDAPWVWGFYGKTLTLRQQWVSPIKPNAMMMNTLKYVSVDVELRQTWREKWNQAVFWPLGVAFALLCLFLLPLVLVHRRQERRVVGRFVES